MRTLPTLCSVLQEEVWRWWSQRLQLFPREKPASRHTCISKLFKLLKTKSKYDEIYFICLGTHPYKFCLIIDLLCGKDVMVCCFVKKTDICSCKYHLKRNASWMSFEIPRKRKHFHKNHSYPSSPLLPSTLIHHLSSLIHQISTLIHHISSLIHHLLTWLPGILQESEWGCSRRRNWNTKFSRNPRYGI